MKGCQKCGDCIYWTASDAAPWGCCRIIPKPINIVLSINWCEKFRTSDEQKRIEEKNW